MPNQQDNQTPGTSQQIDPTALNLSRAIRQVETGNNYDEKGASGEHGVAQWMPGNFEAAAKKYGLDPTDHSPTNQDHVLYEQVKEQLDAGHSQSEVASWWNSGKYDPTGNVGTNKEGVKFDTPAYVEKVKQAYMQASGGSQQDSQGYITRPSLPQPNVEEQQQAQQGQKSPGIGAQLGARLQQGAKALTSGYTAATQGNIGGALSGLLQTVGAGAGAVGDVSNAALELVPGVKQLEDGLSSVLGSAANTPLGQDVINTGKQFAQAHPEIAGDIGAIANITSVLPLFKGLSLAKGALTDAVSSAFRGKLENVASNELTSAIKGRAAQALAKAEGRNLDPIGEIVSGGKYVPDVVETPTGRFVYSSEEGAQNLQSDLSANENNLQSLLEKASPPTPAALAQQGIRSTTGGGMVSLDAMRQKVLAKAAEVFKGSGNYTPALKAINDYFDSVSASLGNVDQIPLQTLNAIKRDARSAVNFDNLGTLRSQVRYHVGQTLMDEIEKMADARGISGVHELNQKMAQQIEGLKLLKAIDGKTAAITKSGKIARGIGADVAGAGGEMLGNLMGIPFAGTFAGRQAGRLIAGRAPGAAFRALKSASSVGKGSRALAGTRRIIGTSLRQTALNKAQSGQ